MVDKLKHSCSEERLPANDYNGNTTLFCAGIESESDGEDEEAESVKTQILSQVARVIGLKKKPLEVDASKSVASSKCGRKINPKLHLNHYILFLHSSSGTLKDLISKTMVRWSQEGKMQDAELVRAVFSLLHCQYQGLSGQMSGPLSRTYTISQTSVDDTVALLSSLSQIRSLLCVRMGKEEEKLMIRKLG